MYLEFSCPKCESDIEISTEVFGERVICPECMHECVAPLPGLQRDLEFDNFVLEKLLGQGGMGEVWLATQFPMERPVAIKILSPHFSKNEDFIELFLHEVRLSGKMEHPNIVTAFTAGIVGDLYYLAMSYIDGHELDELLEVEGVMDYREALKIIRCIAEALKYAWNRYKMLHCDIKPSNIMLDINGTPKLMDMGISKTISEETNQLEGIAGTPYYISPEQARKDKDIDFRSDLYSLGATLYHMVTGQVPFDGIDAHDTMLKHIQEPLVPPRDINHSISKNCSDLIRMMMTKSQWERHSSWEYLINDIDMVLNGRPPAGIDVLAHKQHLAEEEEEKSESEKLKRVLSESTEINLNHKLPEELLEKDNVANETANSRKMSHTVFKTAPPKAIIEKSKWRNWIFVILTIIIFAALGFGIWKAVKATRAYLENQLLEENITETQSGTQLEQPATNGQ
ncbi:MAG: protein kinase [Victivallaceae bacterium]|nr:protein kinase [Victivallaceae bacterium]